jgi:hypothetical protein
MNKGFTYTAAAAVVEATRAESSIEGLWAKAYAAAAADIESGGDLRGLADAITKAGTKCSKDTAGDYVTAARLTAHGSLWLDAIAARIGEGRVMRAHTLTAKARKARGVGYVRSVLATLDGIDDRDALAKALTKAVRELDAAKKEPQTPEGPEAPEGPEDVEVEVEDVETPKAATPADKAASIAAVLASLRADVEAGVEGAVEAADAVLYEAAALARVTKAAKADAA